MAQFPSSIFRNPIHLLAFGFGSGAMPVAPGTFGTLAAVPLYLLLNQLAPPWYLVAMFAAFVAGIFLCDRTARDLGVPDHGGIVWDEFVGYWITMAVAPPGWAWVVAGFVLFRLFDIWKPFPIRWLDSNVHGGLGIMLDDALAGAFAWLSLQLLALVLLA